LLLLLLLVVIVLSLLDTHSDMLMYSLLPTYAYT
jgi:hypothetical protein